MKKPVVPTLPRLRELCRQWQKLLRLQDWDVRISWARGHGIDLATQTEGLCEWVARRKEAKIKVLDPVDWESMDTCDAEQILVHELLHLRFYGFAAKDDTPEDVAQEQAIHALSMALVMLKRADRIR